ncbi:hypothetical protein [Thalassomonas actiniarum]|uniref:Transmembrane protein n=1 Tax=Thalassomonas actiniarum TaxID=485447 RepID=A0AAE9YR93_9GAMM|nr:hypothetical protein [Thalassomonas actiniarum]WDD98823.1 hypothetical protein SG35_026940 [Thalassomonas actiniarum]
MSYEWYILTAIVRVSFLLVPFFNVEKDFNLAGDELEEAKEFAKAANCKTILLSFPVLIFYITLAEADTVCPKGLEPFSIGLTFLLLIITCTLLFYIPTWVYRGNLAPFIWLSGIILLEVIYQISALSNIVNLICNC